jgi:hypothetical protein
MTNQPPDRVLANKCLACGMPLTAIQAPHLSADACIKAWKENSRRLGLALRNLEAQATAVRQSLDNLAQLFWAVVRRDGQHIEVLDEEIRAVPADAMVYWKQDEKGGVVIYADHAPNPNKPPTPKETPP